MVAGNRAALLLNGDEIFPAKLAAIRAARTSITYAEYFWAAGDVAQAIADALAERCRAGVGVSVLVDNGRVEWIRPSDDETDAGSSDQAEIVDASGKRTLLEDRPFRWSNKRGLKAADLPPTEPCWYSTGAFAAFQSCG